MRGERNLDRKLPPSVEDWSSDQRERCTEVRELYGTMYLSNGNDAEVRDPHRLPTEGLPISAYQLRKERAAAERAHERDSRPS